MVVIHNYYILEHHQQTIPGQSSKRCISRRERFVLFSEKNK